MNNYIIKIDGMYFVGTDLKPTGKAPTGGWYDEGSDVPSIWTSPERSKAKVIEGNINLKSYFNKIYESMRYGDLKFEKLEIERVEK